ncbi:MAG TPA: tetratricopeptide repeat protein [Streptosporangiaceae bacterium]|nr:tetratricopeptide repeat protein [Streptosporangiaceae bacterium]
MTQALSHYRQMADVKPAQYLLNVAAALMNLASDLHSAGRGEEALAPMTEAVTLFRQLAEEDPPGSRLNLARSLSNLKNHLSNAGRHHEALDAITEAVALHRQLTGPGDIAQSPYLAIALVNLAEALAAVGRHGEALDACAEAAAAHRRLATANPGRLPYLATSLVNLAEKLSAAGQHEEALDTGGQLSALTEALGTLADCLSTAGRGGDPLLGYQEAAVGLAAGAQGELMAARAKWRADRGDCQGAGADLLRSADLAETETVPFWSGRSRRAVRAAVGKLLAQPTCDHELTGQLPQWAVQPVPDSVADAVHQWQTAPGWERREGLLRHAHPELLSTPGRDALRIARAIYPEYSELVAARQALTDPVGRWLGAP